MKGKLLALTLTPLLILAPCGNAILETAGNEQRCTGLAEEARVMVSEYKKDMITEDIMSRIEDGEALYAVEVVEVEAAVVEPEATEPEMTEPEVTEPEVTEPKVTEPEVTEPEVTEPEVTEPKVTEPEVTEPAETRCEEKTSESNRRSLGTFRLTAYCSCSTCCGQWAKNRPVDRNGNEIVYGASGAVLKAGVSIAVDPEVIRFGTKVEINGHTYTAQDTGKHIKGNRIDVYFTDHQKAREFGIKYAEVFVYG